MFYRILSTVLLLAFLVAINPLQASAQQQNVGPDKRILGTWCIDHNTPLLTVTPVTDSIINLTVHGLVTTTYTMRLLPSTLGVVDGKMQYIPSTDIVRVTRNNKVQFGYFFRYGDGQHYDPDLPIHSVDYVGYQSQTSHEYRITRCK